MPIMRKPTRISFLPCQYIRYSFAGKAVPIRIARVRHSVICLFVFKKFFEILIYYLFLGTYEPQRSRGNSLGTLGRVPKTSIMVFILDISPCLILLLIGIKRSSRPALREGSCAPIVFSAEMILRAHKIKMGEKRRKRVLTDSAVRFSSA